MQPLPTFTDVLLARQTIRPYLLPTPLHLWRGLSDEVGAEVWVKHENHLPTGAFKVRGGVNFIAHLPPDVAARGRVHGIENLYVADAAIMPVIPRANTNLPALVVGERIAAWLTDG